MEREVRYCTTEDGVRIAYCIEGSGPILLLCPWVIESFSQDHLLVEQQAFVQRLAANRRAVRFDFRGTGLSQRVAPDMTPQAWLRDIEGVVAALRARRLALWGAGSSGPIVIEYAARHPTIVSHLILHTTYARLTDAFPLAVIQSIVDLAAADWPAAAQLISDIAIRRAAPETSLRWGTAFAASCDGPTVGRLFLGAYELADARDAASRVTVPTLVMHRRDVAALPLELGRDLAALIPGARFVPLAGDLPHYSLGDSDAVLDTAMRFLGGGRQHQKTPHRTEGVVRTVLFTDIVGHTEMMQRLGDTKGRDVLREHERITRDTLRQHGGAEVKTMGDGFLASFGSVTKAMDCAIALQRAFARHTDSADEPLQVRVGLSAGEPIEEDGDLFGSTVILASRIAAKAGAGEILVPETVRGLLSGKTFLFSDRGEFVPKGFEDAVRLYEVRWRD